MCVLSPHAHVRPRQRGRDVLDSASAPFCLPSGVGRAPYAVDRVSRARGPGLVGRCGAVMAYAGLLILHFLFVASGFGAPQGYGWESHYNSEIPQVGSAANGYM